jgi:hypothetical protein
MVVPATQEAEVKGSWSEKQTKNKKTGVGEYGSNAIGSRHETPGSTSSTVKETCMQYKNDFLTLLIENS